MLTPIEIQSKSFRSGGLGYDKKDVDQFMREVLSNYEVLYRENMELNDKVSTLTQGIQYYKTLEKTLQKALILAEKTAEETKAAALKTAKNIENEALTKSELILADAKNELERIQAQTIQIVQQYEKYKLQFKSLAAAQLELLESECFALNITHLNTFIGNKNARQEIESKEQKKSNSAALDLEKEKNSEEIQAQKEYLRQDGSNYQGLNKDLEHQTGEQQELNQTKLKQQELDQEKIKQQEKKQQDLKNQKENKKGLKLQNLEEQNSKKKKSEYQDIKQQDTYLKEQQKILSEKEGKELSSKEISKEEIDNTKNLEKLDELSFFSIEEEQKKSQEEQVFEELESMGFDFINLEEEKDGE